MIKNLFTLTFIFSFIFSSEKTPAHLYPKFQIRVYSNSLDLTKKPKDTGENNFLVFGEKVKVLNKKNFKGISYFHVELSDKTKSWISSDYLTLNYVVINKNNTAVYTSPKKSSLNKNIILQTGDFGYFKKEKNGYINVEFISYMPREKDNKIVWVGSAWLKEGYLLGDIKRSKEAYLLSNAYNQLYIKTEKNINIQSAKEYLKNAIQINGKEKTEIAKVAEKILSTL